MFGALRWALVSKRHCQCDLASSAGAVSSTAAAQHGCQGLCQRVAQGVGACALAFRDEPFCCSVSVCLPQEAMLLTEPENMFLGAAQCEEPAYLALHGLGCLCACIARSMCY